MKIALKDFQRKWPADGVRGVMLYGQDESAVSLIARYVQRTLKAQKAWTVIDLEAKECLDDSQKLFERVTTQDLFSPQNDVFVHLRGCTDKMVSLLDELLRYPHVAVLVEGLGLPSSSSLVRWGQGHGHVVAVPLYPDGGGWEVFAPFALTTDQARILHAISQSTHESLEHLCEKLHCFIGGDTPLTPDLFQEFLKAYDEECLHDEGLIGEMLRKPETQVIGLSRFLFADCVRHLKPASSSWGRIQKSWFEHMASLPPPAQARIFAHFLTVEMSSMHHNTLPLCAAFRPALAYALEYQLQRGRLDPKEMKDVISIRLCS